jgi:MFS family permease
MIGFIGILLGMFAMGVMQLVLATALPYIVTEIGGNNLYSWVFSSYMLASLITIPIFSKLADMFGKKKFYLLGLGIFALGTIYGGFVPNMSQLIIARVIQGLGAGIITPVSLAMISDMFPENKRGKMIGFFGLVQLLSNLLSPSMGTFITKQLGWHWIFFITVIMILFAMLLIGIGIKASKTKAQIMLSEIDIKGGILFGGFCVLLVGFSNVISKHGKFDISSSLLLIGALVLVLLLILNEKHHENPVIKIEFFQNKILRRAIFSAIIAGAIMYGLVTILPLCGTALSKQGFKIDESKILFFFMIGLTVGMLSGSRLTAKLNSVKFTRILWVTMCLCSTLILYFLNRGNFVVLNVLNVIIGLCTGGIMATFLINSQNAVNSEDRTVLSGLIQLSRYLGASIGVTILTSMLPEVELISSVTQFLGAFILLTALFIAGLVNEII